MLAFIVHIIPYTVVCVCVYVCSPWIQDVLEEGAGVQTEQLHV